MSNRFYIPPSRLALIQGLQNDCNQTGVIAIEGPMGIGKTTIIEELLTSALPNANKCYITAAESLNDIQIRSRVVEQLFGNVLYDPEKPLLTTFLEFHKSVPIMMAIDNGHYLSGQIVGELLQVVAELKKQGCHIVLVISFDKSISNTIGSITSALIMVKVVSGFTQEESYTLLSHSFDNVPSPSSKKVTRWLEAAKGNPTQLLAFDTSDTFNVVKSSQINLKLWGSLLIVGSLILALGVYGYRVFFLKSETANDTIRNSIANEINTPSKPAVVSDWSKAKIDTLAAQKKIKQVTANPISNVDDPNKIENSPTEPLTAVDSDEPTEIENTDDEPISKASQSDILNALSMYNTATNIQLEVEPAVPVAQEQTPEQKKEQQTLNPLPEPAVSPEKESVATALVEELDDKDEGFVTELRIAGYPVKTQEMLSLPADKFVLQLTAVTQEKTLEAYLSNKSLLIEQTRIYRITRNNQPWLILTYGLFDTIADARKAAQDLDPKAWAKSVAVVQQQIKQFNQTLSQ